MLKKYGIVILVIALCLTSYFLGTYTKQKEIEVKVETIIPLTEDQINKQASDKLIEQLNKMHEAEAGAPKQTIIINGN